jgi:pyruvate/2-oxoacid:ferredoxin oxidoreductase alpha subunit
MLQEELRACFYKQKNQPIISGFILGLGGRDIPPSTIKNIYEGSRGKVISTEFIDLRKEVAPPNSPLAMKSR